MGLVRQEGHAFACMRMRSLFYLAGRTPAQRCAPCCPRPRHAPAERGERTPQCELDLGPFRHLLVVFGGPQGLEYALQHDELARQHASPSELFDRWAGLGRAAWGAAWEALCT